jgi:hypothetical protein
MTWNTYWNRASAVHYPQVTGGNAIVVDRLAIFAGDLGVAAESRLCGGARLMRDNIEYWRRFGTVFRIAEVMSDGFVSGYRPRK